MDKIILTDNGKKVLSYMQSNDRVLVGKDMIDATGIKGLYSVLNSLVKKGLIVKDESVIRDFTNNKGVTTKKPYQTYKLTDLGRNFNLND